MLKRASAIVVLLGLAAPTSACTAPRDAESLGDAVQSVTVPDRETALYAAVCSFSLVSYDPTYAIRFYAETSFVPAFGRGNGTMTLALTPLVGWDSVAGAARPPTAVTSAQTHGTRISATSPTSEGAFSALYPVLDLDPEANSINGVRARVEDLRLDAVAGTPDRFCAGFSGKLTDPVEYEFVREENTCIFVKVNDGDPLPSLAASDFHCP
jgi:hypothetical protein